MRVPIALEASVTDDWGSIPLCTVYVRRVDLIIGCAWCWSRDCESIFSRGAKHPGNFSKPCFGKQSARAQQTTMAARD
jgi:hypothetical protein